MRVRSLLFVLPVVLCLLPATLSAQMTWTQATDSAGWGPRSSHTSVVFDGKMWVLGGAKEWPTTYANDVWWSTDGATWTCATDSAPWQKRCCHASVVFDNKMWVLGGLGWDGSAYAFLHDVWWSTDGASWICATDSAPWSGRENHQVTTFDNRMWLVAGVTNFNPPRAPREVWYSTDGGTWVCANAAAPWVGREAPALEVYHDTMWLMGGQTSAALLNDVWCSTDGDSWVRRVGAAPWSKRWGHRAVVLEDRLWMTGGLGQERNVNDVWCSTDGAAWACADTSADWRPRACHTSLVFNDRIWVLGGDSTYNFYTTRDVWSSPGLGVEEDRPRTADRLPLTATIVHGVLVIPTSLLSTHYSLLSTDGRMVADLHAGANDVSRLSPGIYFVRSALGVQREASRVAKVVLTR